MRDRLLTGALLGLVALTAHAGGGPPGLELRNDGIEFPDGSIQTTAAGSYAGVLIVAKSGGDYTSVQSALDAIGTDLPAATESDPYLIWIAPGVYQEAVTMKEWVDIQGSGEKVTRIRKISDASDMSPTVTGADHAELRFLTVENTGGAYLEDLVAIWNDGASPTLTHVTALATAGPNGDHIYGVYNSGSSSPRMTDVVASASGGDGAWAIRNDSLSGPVMTNIRARAWGASWANYGVASHTSYPRLINVWATASGGSNAIAISNRSFSDVTMIKVTAVATGGSNLTLGVSENESSNASIRGSYLEGSDAAIWLFDTDSSVDVAHSMLDGEVLGDGTSTCFSVCNQNLEGLDSGCQPPVKD
jgi:hypothetical protein